jgi:hypothetical protein
MGLGGHIHDGGTRLDVIVNKEVICSSVPTYGTNEEAMARAEITKAGGIPNAAPRSSISPGTSAGGTGGHSHGSGNHIIAMSVCGEKLGGYNGSPVSPLKLKKLTKGQSWTVTAYYYLSL